MRITVSDVLRRSDLQLRVVVDPGPAPLNNVVSWVVSSDLADPTPFLDRGHLLLTTGRQFLPDNSEIAAMPAAPVIIDQRSGIDQRYTGDADSYVARLHRRGVAGIGFGIRVLHAAIPPALVEACRRHRMPLFEVPYHIPFIAVIREVADLIDAAGHRRGSWALNATRAISTVALRPQSLDAVLGELGRQLGRGVVLVDARGRARSVHGLAMDDPLVDTACREAAALLSRGRRSGATVTVPLPPPVPSGVVPVSAAQRALPLPAELRRRPGARAPSQSVLTMQTIGQDAHLRGVLLVVGAGGVDSAEQMVVAAVVALLWYALGESWGREELRRALTTALVPALESGNVAMVRAGAQVAGMRLPAEPLRIAVFGPGDDRGVCAAMDAACEDGAEILHAKVDGRRVVYLPAGDLDRIRELNLPAGVCEPVTYAQAAAGRRRAARAADRAVEGEVVVLDQRPAGDLVALLRNPDGIDAARGTLLALAEDPAGPALKSALVAWLETNGNFESAARRLGVHRHTMRDRVGRAATVLGRNLDDPETRVELWLALRLTAEEHGGAVRSGPAARPGSARGPAETKGARPDGYPVGRDESRG